VSVIFAAGNLRLADDSLPTNASREFLL